MDVDPSPNPDYHHRRTSDSGYYNQGNRNRFPSDSFSNSPYHSSPGAHLMSPVTARPPAKHAENRRNSELSEGPKLSRPFKDHPVPSTSSPNPPVTPPIHQSQHFSTSKIQHRLKNRRRRAVTVWDGKLVLAEKFEVSAQMLHYGHSTSNRIPHRNINFTSRVPNSVASDIFKTLNHSIKTFCTPAAVKGDTFLHGSWIALPAQIERKLQI